ncbi:MAG: hypothetical protein MUF60_05640 [Vicinamibacterales bacterium]|jgi:hypothetical protein|nr:hypothetical protein [Vicinamibacterales bacterium]
MEQRRLRPGDSLEDYCPRERRVTDHVVVAVVDDTVKQTRCAACDTEHPFKEGRTPPRRKTATTAGLVAQVLDDLGVEPNGADGHAQPALVLKPERKPARAKRGTAPPPAAGPDATPPLSPFPSAPLPPSIPPDAAPLLADSPQSDEEGPVHRRLIRATLPRPEGQPQARPIPEFTMRQPGARGGTPFGRGATGNRFGRPAGNGFSPWFTKPNGHGNRAGASTAGPGGEPRGHQKGRSRGGRSQHKKAR